MDAMPARLLGILVLLAGLARAAEPDVVVIVHPSRTEPVTLQDVKHIFLRQRRFWADRQPILPVNREYGSQTRMAFERVVFGDLKVPLSRYWNEQYFLGTLPPATLASDSAVRQYVAARPDAVGYIDARSVDASVRVAVRLE